jgi:peptidoglycan/LPS O-acetylase OafA/YrhL
MKRIPIIDFVRFFSIFVVIGGHFFPRWIAYGYPEGVRNFILGLFLNGPYGVTFFFVVSGFLITQLLVGDREDFSNIELKSFYIKRVARIFPLLTVIVLVGFLLPHLMVFMDAKLQNYNEWDIKSGFGFFFWLSLITFNFNWFVIHTGEPNVGAHWAVLWSLAVEEQFYFFYPLILKKLKNKKNVFLFLGTVIFFAIVFRSWAFLNMNHKDVWMHEASFSVFDQIAVGAGLYFLWNSVKNELNLKFWTAFLLFISGMIICFFLYVKTSINGNEETIFTPTLMAVGCALVILGGIHLPFFNTKLAETLSRPGKLSYGSYLWHQTIIFVLMPLWAWLGGLSAFTVLFIIVLSFSYISYEYFEVPVNHHIRAWFKLKRSTTEN